MVTGRWSGYWASWLTKEGSGRNIFSAPPLALLISCYGSVGFVGGSGIESVASTVSKPTCAAVRDWTVLSECPYLVGCSWFLPPWGSVYDVC